MIIAICAVDSQLGIARNGVLPWPFSKEDMKWFKSQTTNQVVVMGKKTWDAPDMPSPLPNRYNAVFTHEENNNLFCEHLSGNVVDELTRLQKEHPEKNIFVIGGASIFEQSAAALDAAYITRIDGDYECDTVVNLSSVIHGMVLTETTVLSPTQLIEIYKREK